ncbi:MAG: MBL fold metallo-hydrolase [Promethearchaeota archaeon]|jgi:Cft2 family RNA processing exonuclease
MVIEEFSFLNNDITIEEREKLDSSYKIKSYKEKLKLMKQKKIPQKKIKEVIEHLFLKNNLISKKTKNSISKVIYCQEDRIIIVVTKSGKEIIYNRDKLIQKYGWFFYIAKSEKKQKDKKKELKKEELTVSTETYQYDEHSIILKEKRNMRSLYNTKEYFHYKKLMESNNIDQIPINDVLDDFFLKNDKIPNKEKKSIKKIIYYQEERVIVIKSLIGDIMYENLEEIVRNYGWHFYITGIPVGDSKISIAIDKIEKKYDESYFNEISLINSPANLNNARITIYPIVLKPNHNSHILSLGNLNILLDCGLTEPNEEEEIEGDIRHIEYYLQNLSEIINEEIRRKSENEIADITSTEENLENSIELKKFEKEKNNVINEPKIDAIFLSHSHYDHVSGLKELIRMYPEVPILCSRISLDLYLLRDSNFLKQESQEEIDEEEYRNIVRNVIYVENGTKLRFKEKGCYLSFYHAGHMPGALMLLAKAKNFRFLYTGDYTYHDITPFAGTRRFLGQISRPIDYLLIDGTSAMEDYGNLSDQFHSLILFLEQKAEYEDNVLIGADPSSLAITFMLIFWRYFRKLQLRKGFKKRPNIYVDMMVRKNIQVINHRYEYIYGPISNLIGEKANPFNSIKFRWFDLDDLDFLRKKNNIIISHPPDLSYGIIRNIINVIGRNPHNLVFLAGSINEKPGEDLIDGSDEIRFSETWKVPFRAFLINTFIPSLKIKLHADKNQLTEMVKTLEPKEVCFFHQSAKKLIDIVDYVKELGVEKVSLPKKRRLTILN